MLALHAVSAHKIVVTIQCRLCKQINKSPQETRYPNVTWRIILSVYFLIIYH